MTPNPEQLRFMRLHLRLVTTWRWHMLETQLQAWADAGRSATIWRSNLDELTRAGLMRCGHGQAMELTDAGRQMVRLEAVT